MGERNSRNIMVVWDRDGTMNINNKMDLPNGEPGPFFVLSKKDIHWREGAVEAIILLTTAGIMSSVVTKQNCIGQGLIALGHAHDINRRMHTFLRAKGGKVQTWKIVQGKTGKAAQGAKLAALKTIAGQYGCNVSDCFGVGDSEDDIIAYNLGGMTSIYVLTTRGEQTCPGAHHTVATPFAAAKLIVELVKGG